MKKNKEKTVTSFNYKAPQGVRLSSEMPITSMDELASKPIYLPKKKENNGK